MNGMKNYEIKMTAATRPLIHHPKQVAVLCRAMRLSSLSSICQFYSLVHEWNVKICNVFFSPALSRLLSQHLPLSFCFDIFMMLRFIRNWWYSFYRCVPCTYLSVESECTKRHSTARHGNETRRWKGCKTSEYDSKLFRNSEHQQRLRECDAEKKS